MIAVVSWVTWFCTATCWRSRVYPDCSAFRISGCWSACSCGLLTCNIHHFRLVKWYWSTKGRAVAIKDFQQKKTNCNVTVSSKSTSVGRLALYPGRVPWYEAKPEFHPHSTPAPTEWLLHSELHKSSCMCSYSTISATCGQSWRWTSGLMHLSVVFPALPSCGVQRDRQDGVFVSSIHYQSLGQRLR